MYEGKSTREWKKHTKTLEVIEIISDEPGPQEKTHSAISFIGKHDQKLHL
ncbi:MAG: hypothetical protein UU48_C0001G0043 [Candidatus Uhrbacteria bacterium GW2011_GWF2_41_16]|uniref:Uncharacterized protein n=2 Tax=Candidatus Uhriibacteriota TaxID=1752732 RepID=A0A0G0VCU2_9BACT|nr:MAG: hypothetical protein UU31_C0002G0146 [Candidatus Uhrbacteria bacterium GW2011_GWA2_41_10]KKR87749.1 MAG: hypothetical protein UU35_C0001G0030 [Candidatus Uhrbacteria bacterium GW2011_GWC2_41_11]KKR98688.1 MAG: hypothetical protein UU48_C0001G0043 [Candidatus Uhrbacteria bacterium GW2011_GWF2_41_16]